MMDSFLEIHGDAVALKGAWTLANFARIRSEVEAAKAASRMEASGLEALDSAGGLLLIELARKLKVTEPVEGLAQEHAALLKLVLEAPRGEPPEKARQGVASGLVIRLGKAAVQAWRGTLELVAFIGEASVTLARGVARPHTLRWNSIVRHIDDTGINAVPIICLIAFLISLVLAYQSVNQLRRFGAEIFTIDMIALSVLREMGVLLTAIMVAGRSGSAFTAEIGVMQVNEEVDAMRVIGIRPFEVLVLPRLIALMITLPVLTFIADIMGLFAGGVMCSMLIGVPIEQYLDRLHMAAAPRHFWVGMIKAPVFAFLIGVVGCMRGMQVTGSAESVGRLTTVSVVQSIFLVLLADALFSILFSEIGW